MMRNPEQTNGNLIDKQGVRHVQCMKKKAGIDRASVIKQKDIVILFFLLFLDIATLSVFLIHKWMPWAIALAISLWLTLDLLLRFGRGFLKKSRLKPGSTKVLTALTHVVSVVTLIYGVFWFVQDMALFHPSHDPASWAYLTSQPDYEAIEFSSGNKTLHGLLRRSTNEL